MEQIRIDLGLKSYEVCDIDGNVLGVLTFNPADAGIAGRLQEASDTLRTTIGTLSENDMTPEKLIEADKTIREQLDYALGAKGAADILLGGGSALALSGTDGGMVIEKILQAIMPIIEAETGKAADKMNQRVSKHTAKYNSSKRGLAPGQQL